MSKLLARLEKLEARMCREPRPIPLICYDPAETDLSYEEFMAAERKRLGIIKSRYPGEITSVVVVPAGFEGANK